MREEQSQKLAKTIDKLTEAVEKLRDERYLQIIQNKKKFLWYNFLTGAAKGLGLVVGSTLLLALFLWIVSQLITVPVIGEWIVDLINYIEQARLR